MLLYLLRKIFLALPALWLLATLFFLASRVLPGSFGEERILDTEDSFYSKSSQGGRESAYRDYLRKTGQDQPLFYLGVSSAAVPDTITRILPEQRREQLQQLAYTYGDWPAVAAFDAQVQQLAGILAQQPHPKAGTDAQVLRYSTDPQKLLYAARALQSMEHSTALTTKASAVAGAVETLEQNKLPYRYLLPQITWHGTGNQYHLWLKGLLSGNWSNSYRTGRPVLEMIWERTANTFMLLLISMVLTLALALELSVSLSKRRMRWLRRVALPSLFLLDSIPVFVLALLLLVLLANPDFLQLFPVYGMGYYVPSGLSAWQKLEQWLQYMALPITVLVLVNLPYITNQVYTSLQVSLAADYTRTAQAKGLPEHLVIRRHALRNALLPLITVVSDFLPALVSGSIIIETVYAIPGMGRLLVDSVLARDYPVLVAIILVVLVVRTTAYVLADMAYAWADPRIKREIA